MSDSVDERSPCADTVPYTAICDACGLELRKSKYPEVRADLWFDRRGLAGCPKGGFHMPQSDGYPATD